MAIHERDAGSPPISAQEHFLHLPPSLQLQAIWQIGGEPIIGAQFKTVAETGLVTPPDLSRNSEIPSKISNFIAPGNESTIQTLAWDEYLNKCNDVFPDKKRVLHLLSGRSEGSSWKQGFHYTTATLTEIIHLVEHRSDGITAVTVDNLKSVVSATQNILRSGSPIKPFAAAWAAIEWRAGKPVWSRERAGLNDHELYDHIYFE